MKPLILILVSLSFLMVGGCKERLSEPTSTKTAQAVKAQQAAQRITFTENAEIENIEKRLNLTSSPSLLGYVVLMNQAGQPVLYTSVKGKITSGGKRLTSPQRLVKGDRGEWRGEFVMQSPSDEGTWGRSAPYIFFWDTNGAYHQWNGKYLYSDKPIRLSIKPLVVAIGEEIK